MNPTRAARALRRMAELDEARAAAARELAAALEAAEAAGLWPEGDGEA